MAKKLIDVENKGGVFYIRGNDRRGRDVDRGEQGNDRGGGVDRRRGNDRRGQDVDRRELDVQVENEGSVFTFEALTDGGRAWIAENVHTESWQWLGRKLVVDHRFALELSGGMQESGLYVA